jgi:putative peptide zinc metalloprotease protein
MTTEMAIAAVAAVVWASTAAGSVPHALAYNLMFVGSVSTLLFNANPLLRYDGYYILSDILEIPNLAQRSRDYLYFLVRRWAWGVKQARDPAHTRGERIWMVLYAILSTIYRVFISVAILLFISSRLPFVGALLAVAAVVAWLLVPLGRFVHYLVASSELMRVRTRAVGSTLAVAVLLVAGLGLIPAPDRSYVEGVVEPVQFAIVYAAGDGFLRSHLPSGSEARPDGPPLIECVNPELEAEARQWEAQRRELLARRSLATTKDVALVQTLDEQLLAVDDKIRDVQRRLGDLAVHAPFAGRWFSPQLDLQGGAYLHRGDPVGVTATPGDMIVRAVAGQEVAGVLSIEAGREVEMRVDGQP